jgi:hypothetical protein
MSSSVLDERFLVVLQAFSKVLYFVSYVCS